MTTRKMNGVVSMLIMIGLLFAASACGAGSAKSQPSVQTKAKSSAQSVASGAFPLVFLPMKLHPRSGAIRIVDVLVKNRSNRTRKFNLNIEWGSETAFKPLKVTGQNAKFKEGPSHTDMYAVTSVGPGKIFVAHVVYRAAIFNKMVCTGTSMWVMDDNSDNRQPAKQQCWGIGK